MGLRGLFRLTLLGLLQLVHIHCKQLPGQAVNSVQWGNRENVPHPLTELRGLPVLALLQLLILELQTQSFGQAVNSVQWAPVADVPRLPTVLRGLANLTSRQFLVL